MAIVINDEFVREWHPRYDDIADDEPEYERLVVCVARDMNSSRKTISKDIFLAIWKWKGAMRVIGRIDLEEYDKLYAEAFRRAASEPPERKLAELVNLPGVGAPTGSTIIHFIHPKSMPIMDVRTVEVLFSAGLVSTKARDLEHYQEFRLAIEHIRNACPRRSLREIDRALFAYHKLVLDEVGHRRTCGSLHPSSIHESADTRAQGKATEEGRKETSQESARGGAMKPHEITCVVVPLSQQYSNGLERVELYVCTEFIASVEKAGHGEGIPITFSTPHGDYEGTLRNNQDKYPYVCPGLHSKRDGTKTFLANILKDNGFKPRDRVRMRISDRIWTLLGSE
jgi:hypothetical protein